MAFNKQPKNTKKNKKNTKKRTRLSYTKERTNRGTRQNQKAGEWIVYLREWRGEGGGGAKNGGGGGSHDGGYRFQTSAKKKGTRERLGKNMMANLKSRGKKRQGQNFKRNNRTNSITQGEAPFEQMAKKVAH